MATTTCGWCQGGVAHVCMEPCSGVIVSWCVGSLGMASRAMPEAHVQHGAWCCCCCAREGRLWQVVMHVETLASWAPGNKWHRQNAFTTQLLGHTHFLDSFAALTSPHSCTHTLAGSVTTNLRDTKSRTHARTHCARTHAHTHGACTHARTH